MYCLITTGNDEVSNTVISHNRNSELPIKFEYELYCILYVGRDWSKSGWWCKDDEQEKLTQEELKFPENYETRRQAEVSKDKKAIDTKWIVETKENNLKKTTIVKF